MATVTEFAVLLPQIGISVVSWSQLVFSMNRYRGACAFTITDMWALLLFLHGGFVRWVAALSVRTMDLPFQILVSLIGAALGWTSFVVVFNQGFVLPTRQQTIALGMSLIITALWEVNNFLIFHMAQA
tara:strand:- start:523 stop:906 length:384 start_codon:yes stop_codon:yes gene_type:complete